VTRHKFYQKWDLEPPVTIVWPLSISVYQISHELALSVTENWAKIQNITKQNLTVGHVT